MSGLRNKLIRLAKENPELRSDLLPLLKESSNRLWYEDASWRAGKYKAVRDGVLKEVMLFIKTAKKQLAQQKKAYASLHTLYNITTDVREKDKLEKAMNILKGHHTFLSEEKELLETSVGSVSRLLTDLENKGPQYAWVLISDWAGSRAYPMHLKVRKSLEYHQRLVGDTF